jgi:hypothetical protein
MAFSTNPQFSTEQTKPIKFDGTAFYRSGSMAIQRDCNIVNMFYDRVSNENKEQQVALKKRSGLSATTYNLTKVSSSDTIRGFFYDSDQNAFYWAVLDKVYVCRPDVGVATTLVTTLATTTGQVGFCNFLKSTGTRYVLFSDGTDLWVDDYVAVSCNKVVDADMPTPHEPCPVYLDGYVLLIKKNTSDMYNSDNDDPTSWTAGEFISAEISSDYSLKIAKAKNYIVTLGKDSIEYFWDAGNATSSPFSRNDSPFRAVGYVTGLATIGDTTYFVGKDKNQNVAVYSLNSFKVDMISNSVVNRTLQTYVNTQNQKSPINLDREGYCISVDGHTYYVIVTTQVTWAYDVDEHFWYEWRTAADAPLSIEAAWTMNGGSMYVAITGQTYISVMNPANYQDFGSNFTCQYTTEDFTAETNNWKVVSRVVLHCDMHNYTGTSNLQLTWSDNDWADGGITTPRNINVFSSSPMTFNTGRFRNRSFRLKYADNYPIRMYGMEMRLNIMGN